MEAAVLIAVFQLQRGSLYGADTAHEVLVHRVRPLGKRLVVPALIGHVVGVGGQQNKIVGLAHVHGVDDAPVQRLAGILIPGIRLTDGLQQAVLVAVGHLCGGKLDVEEISAQRAGQSFFHKAQIHLLFLLGHESHGGVNIRNDLLVAVDVAAVDFVDGASVRLEAPAYFVEFFLVHSVSVRMAWFLQTLSYHRLGVNERCPRGEKSREQQMLTLSSRRKACRLVY